MAASNRTPKDLQTTGAIVLTVGALAAWGLTWIPTLFETRTTEYSALIPLSMGARGLEAGGQVLYGGAPRGEITSVRTERDPETGMPTEIRVVFTLDRALPLAEDATISKSLGIAGTNGAIAISNPGTPGEAFTSGERRVLHSGGQATVLELLATPHCQLACSAADARSSSFGKLAHSTSLYRLPVIVFMSGTQ